MGEGMKKLSFDQISNKYKKRRVTTLIIFLISLFLMVVTFFLNNLIGLFSALFLLCINVVCYIPFLFSISQSTKEILITELDPVRAIQVMGLLKPDTGTLPTLNYAYSYLIVGDLDKSKGFLDKISEEKLQKNVIKDNLIYYLYIKSFLEVLRDDLNAVEEFDNKLQMIPLKNPVIQDNAQKRMQFLKAISDIEQGKKNDYFETSFPNHNLEKLIHQYYQARNLLIASDTSSAKELLEKVASENEDIIFVREAKKYLEELQ